MPTPSELDDRFEEIAARARGREEAYRAERGLWLSHHHPHDYERCAFVKGRPVCRRCLVLYPLSFSVALLTLAGGSPWPVRYDAWVIWALCIPGSIDFIGEQLGFLRYSPRRQIAVMTGVALAFGRALGLELQDRWQWLFWGPVLICGNIWFLAVVVGRYRRRDDWRIEATRRAGHLPVDAAPGATD